MRTSVCTALIFVMALSACNQVKTPTSKTPKETIPVKIIALQQQLIQEPIKASGSFTTDDEAIRSFMTGGVVQQILVQEGDKIKKGQLLASLDPVEIKALVNQADLAYEKAEREYQRVNNLYRDSVVSLEQLQNATTAIDMAKEQLTQARFNQAYSEIRATENGFVLKKFVNEGQIVGPGSPVFLTNGAGKDGWTLKVAVSDAQWGMLQIGDKAVIETDIINMKTVNATVSKKAEGVDPMSGTFTIDLKPDVSMGRTVASGMFGKASIIPSVARKLWRIPYDALLDGDGNTGFVFVTCDNKTAQRKKVSVADISRDYVLIDSGLDSCDNLIITGSAYLTDNSSIQIID